MNMSECSYCGSQEHLAYCCWRRLRDENEQLQAELADYKDAEKFVNDPPHDQECCGCVAILRKQIGQLQTDLIKYGLHLDNCSCYIPPGTWESNSHHTKTKDELNISEVNGFTVITIKCTCGFERVMEGDK